MVLNTTNVSSWMLLNALVPASLPESVQSQYKDQFVVWSSRPKDVQSDLFFALKALRLWRIGLVYQTNEKFLYCRSAIKHMLEGQFTRMHVQPLVELSTTIRLKCLGSVIEKCSDCQ